jgi:hypothetical protein
LLFEGFQFVASRLIIMSFPTQSKGKNAVIPEIGIEAMFYELVRAIVQKIFQDKILAGLVIVGFLAIFVGGFSGHHGDRVASGSREARVTAQSRSQPNAAGPAGQGETTPPPKPQADPPEPAPQPKVEVPDPGAVKIEPALATQFIGWWTVRALDFNPQTAFKNRQEAMSWITPEALPSYQAAFWPQEVSDGLANGSIQGNFTMTSVTAVASNPDGSMVVNVCGNLMLQQGQKPALQQLSTDYLIKREAGGLRIAGLYNRAVLLQGPTY